MVDELDTLFHSASGQFLFLLIISLSGSKDSRFRTS